MSEWSITYPTAPPAWAPEDSRPFRCGRCGQMVTDGHGKWAVRDQPRDPAHGMPGQFMAVHDPKCPRRWWFGR